MKRRRDFETVPRVYTVAEAAVILQVEDGMLRRAIRAGELQAARLGRIYRIREENLLEYLEGKKVRPRACEGVSHGVVQGVAQGVSQGVGQGASEGVGAGVGVGGDGI